MQPTDEVSVLNVRGYTFLSLPHKAGSGGGSNLYMLNQHGSKRCEHLKNANLESI